MSEQEDIRAQSESNKLSVATFQFEDKLTAMLFGSKALKLGLIHCDYIPLPNGKVCVFDITDLTALNALADEYESWD
ncbi:hypothetical protein [Lyngbya sp. PCC 8106]|uniref:hypothetical protein n=1 Tax=Lyngbya sp. (strain PCC 8106) TaxID=313612 RepID=UPI0000EA9906|nr:hypothetical protein [Lyngbya sp. PCC 8106]EAW35206.1 hypothetical protein L8106_13865 [Lyngbya sp. PCC 8106]